MMALGVHQLTRRAMSRACVTQFVTQGEKSSPARSAKSVLMIDFVGSGGALQPLETSH
jgi:hypothetical protein